MSASSRACARPVCRKAWRRRIEIGSTMSSGSGRVEGCARLRGPRFGEAISRSQWMTALARIPVLPEAILVGALTALLRRSPRPPPTTALDPKEAFAANNGTPQIDPELPFRVGTMNGRKRRKSGLWLNRGFRQQPTFVEAKIVEHRGHVNSHKAIADFGDGLKDQATAVWD
jgi:hypothetical protein